MYPEGFEDLEEAEKGPKRTTYVSSMNQQDSDKLLRENERLKKSLEKEKFFNKLLDQELKDLKSSGQTNSSDPAYPYQSETGVPKRSFYAVLFLAIGMAGFIGYTLYFNKQYDIFSSPDRSAQLQPLSDPEPDVSSSTTNSTDDGQTTFASPSTPRQELARQKREQALAAGAAAARRNTLQKDSVPNIIGAKKNTPAPARKKESTAAPAEEYDESEVEAELNEPVTRSPQRAVTRKPATTTTPTATTPAVSAPANTANTPAPSTAVTPPPVAENKTVLARYRVTSKANFYNAADENTLRSVFISGGNEKYVDALEDQNGFIYVVYTNDLGYTSRGWLSKKDLTKVE